MSDLANAWHDLRDERPRHCNYSLPVQVPGWLPPSPSDPEKGRHQCKAVSLTCTDTHPTPKGRRKSSTATTIRPIHGGVVAAAAVAAAAVAVVFAFAVRLALSTTRVQNNTQEVSQHSWDTHSITARSRPASWASVCRLENSSSEPNSHSIQWSRTVPTFHHHSPMPTTMFSVFSVTAVLTARRG